MRNKLTYPNCLARFSKLLSFTLLLVVLSGCWPKSFSFNDSGSIDPSWEYFAVINLENFASNAPVQYAVDLSESIRSGVQNNSKLKLTNTASDAQIEISGKVMNYSIAPIALQQDDNALKNRLSIQAQIKIYYKTPEEREEVFTSSRFADYDASQDLTSVEQQLLEEINKQITQDILNKLFSNW